MMLSKYEIAHVLDAAKDAYREFEELMDEREWYVTNVTDKLESAIQLLEEVQACEENRTDTVRQEGA